MASASELHPWLLPAPGRAAGPGARRASVTRVVGPGGLRCAVSVRPGLGKEKPSAEGSACMAGSPPRSLISRLLPISFLT